MKEFFYDMHSSSDKIRSKSIYASYFVILLTAMIVGQQFFKMPIDYTIFFAILTTFTALCGMNLTAQLKAMNVKRDVASDIVKETGDSEQASQTLQSDKPQ